MNVLVACECSGVVKMAFRNLGHNAWSCDLKPSEIPNDKFHIQGDIREIIKNIPEWDLLIAHPDCQYLASSGLHWNHRTLGRQEKTDEALEFVRWILALPVSRIAVENPIGCISSQIGKPEQIIQPYQFGEDASKATCLWLKNLPKLKPTGYVNPHYRCPCGGMPFEYELGKYGCPNCNGERIAKLVWGNQTASGQNKLAPSDHRKADRARTYPGIATAMAEQWGNLLPLSG